MPPNHQRRLDRLSAELPNPDADPGDVGDLDDDALLSLLLRHLGALPDAELAALHHALPNDQLRFLDTARTLLPDRSDPGIDAALAAALVPPAYRPALAALLRAHRPTRTEGSPTA